VVKDIMQIHAVLLLTGLLFVLFANLQYEVFTIQVAFSVIFFLSALYITYRTHTQTDEYSYHRLDLIPSERSSSDSEVRNGERKDGSAEDDEGDNKENQMSTNYLPLIVSILSLATIVVHLVAAFLLGPQG
jgi:hypothetical protein